MTFRDNFTEDPAVPNHLCHSAGRGRSGTISQIRSAISLWMSESPELSLMLQEQSKHSHPGGITAQRPVVPLSRKMAHYHTLFLHVSRDGFTIRAC